MKKLFRFIPIFLLASSCTQIEPDPPTPENPPSDNTVETVGIDPNTTTLSQIDAETVACMFADNQQSSRTTSKTTVKNVVTINGKDGLPALYAVNFDEGYTIVPATKSLPPILAKVDKGSFSLDDEPFGRDVLIDQMINEIEYWRSKGENPEHKAAWRFYTKHSAPNLKPISREAPGTDPWYVQSDIMDELTQQGYTCFQLRRLVDEQEDVPNDILERFKERVRSEDNIWERQDEELMYKTAFIAVKYDTGASDARYFHLLKTKWHQGYPYNSALSTNRPLGCVTVAVGQIMRYHEYPATFNWASMINSANESGNFSTTASFLKTIHDDLGIDTGSGASIGDAERVLKKYGYSTNKVSHTKDVYRRFPTYCRASSNALNIGGHAWVCDGINYIYSRNDYDLYILDVSYYPKFKFIKIDEAMEEHSNRLYHMNWGFVTVENGFFRDGYLNIKVDDEQKNYNYHREDIEITKP